MVGRKENGKLYFDDMTFSMMLDDMLDNCESKEEVKFLIGHIRDCTEMFCDVAESDWDIE